MLKSSLETGMLVEIANGAKGIVLKEHNLIKKIIGLCPNEEGIIWIENHERASIPLECYDRKLNLLEKCIPGNEIVKVKGYPDNPNYLLSTVEGEHERPTLYFTSEIP